jgi:hypothetical protein
MLVFLLGIRMGLTPSTNHPHTKTKQENADAELSSSDRAFEL